MLRLTITRCKAEFPQTRIIVMSTGTIPGMHYDVLATGAHLGAGATLRKPFTADRLLDTVRTYAAALTAFFFSKTILPPRQST
jgi:hypothetical protein